MENTNSNPQTNPPQPLTPDVALQNLVVAARQARLSYQEHAIIDASINVLAKLVQETSGGPAPLSPE